MTHPRDCVPALHEASLHEMAEWASERPIRHGWKGRTCRDLWASSPRGDWLLGYAEKAGADRRDMVRAAAACVRPALRFIPEGEDRPRLAVEAAERWADEPTEENRELVRLARQHVGWTAARARAGVGAGAARAAWAAWAAADAVDFVAGQASLLAAGRAAGAAWAAGRAHGHAEGQESEAAAHRACADEVRRLVPFLDLSAGGVR